MRKATETKGMSWLKTQARGLTRGEGRAARQEAEVLPLPVGVRKLAGVDEENQIKAWFEFVFVQAENFPDLPFGAVTFNCITEFFG
jgi:hypothetical protein